MEGMKLRTKSMIWNIKKKRILKNEDRLRSLWDIFKCTKVQITGMPEREEEEQEIENLFEKNNGRKLP